MIWIILINIVIKIRISVEYWFMCKMIAEIDNEENNINVDK
jgi:hypothetical protein